MKIRHVLSALVALVLATTGTAQAREAALGNVQLGLDEFHAHRYAEAARYFQQGYPYTLEVRAAVYAYAVSLARIGSPEAEAMLVRATQGGTGSFWDKGNESSRSSIIAGAHFELGRIQERRGDWQSALSSYLNSSPTNLAARLSAGIILKDKYHDYHQAIPHFEALLGDLQGAAVAKANLALCYYELGQQFEKAGDPKQAIDCYKKSSAYDPTFDQPKVRVYVIQNGNPTPPKPVVRAAPPPPVDIKLPKEQVAEFFAALDAQDLDKVTAMLKTEPRLAVTSSADPMNELPLLRASTPELATALLQAGADLTKRSKSGWSAMEMAATRDNPGVAQVFLAKGASVNASNYLTGKRLLHLAVDNFVGPTDTIEWLLSHGALINAQDDLGETPLMLAAQGESSRRVAELLVAADADLTLKNKEGKTAADVAGASEQPEFAGQLRTLAKQGRSLSKILWRAAEAKDLAAFRAPLDAFPSLAVTQVSNGFTPLHLAATAGFVEGVKCLLDAKAPVNAQDNEGQTPLYCAVRDQHVEVVKVLLAGGADPNLADQNSSSPVLKAAGTSKGTACLALLLAAGANANARDTRSPALMFAVSGGALDNVRLLLEHGGDPNVPLGDGWTLLHAAYGGMTEELIKHGANVNSNGAIGTPLHRRVEQRDFETVKLLVAHGADVNLRNPDGETPLDLAADAAKQAASAGKPSPEIKEMIRFLTAHGAKRGKA